LKRRALLVAWGFGKGRSAACTGDMVPPREPRMFTVWNGDDELWSRILCGISGGT